MPTEINLSGPFYTKYRAENSTYNPETFDCAEVVVTKLLTHQTTSEHPGMLLGKVQSGKTRAFISIMALAFDNSFDIAIVLSKNSKALIQQTAKRLRSEFRHFIEDGDLDLYDIMEAPSSFNSFELNAKLIFVAKKEANNLKRLIALFETNDEMASKHVLLIDDEADNASVGYARRDGQVEATKIAGQISELRSAIERSSFLQVTATPYSLYLQPSEIEVDNVFEFKPVRPTFTELVPVPPEYVGGETYFGEASQSGIPTIESLIHHPIDAMEFDRLKKPDRRSFKLDDVLTTPAIKGYRTALITFFVGGCIQRMIGSDANVKEKKLRYSFLLHSESGKGAHEWQERVTEEIVIQLRAAAEARDPLFDMLTQSAYDDLAQSLVLAGSSVPALDSVSSTLRKALAGEYVNICKVNSDDDVATLLDDTGQLKLRTPLNVFLGGQVLDRGVTLANLIGFYYGRRPKKFQQDTVLQHSRMYGYRRQDLAVTRFYTAASIRTAMGKMEEFDAALRDAVQSGGDRAVQFIQRAANGTVIPCSPNKIMIASTQTLGPFKRMLPIGFQSGYRTGKDGIGSTIDALDRQIADLCGFGEKAPTLIDLDIVLEILAQIATTLRYEDDDEALGFDWGAAEAALRYLSEQHSDPAQRGKVFVWAATDRNATRLVSAGSHATYGESPDSEKTEGKLAREFAIEHPIVFLLRQNGDEAVKGWRDTPFYWPVIRAQKNTPTAIFTSDTIS